MTHPGPIRTFPGFFDLGLGKKVLSPPEEMGRPRWPCFGPQGGSWPEGMAWTGRDRGREHESPQLFQGLAARTSFLYVQELPQDSSPPFPLHACDCESSDSSGDPQRTLFLDEVTGILPLALACSRKLPLPSVGPPSGLEWGGTHTPPPRGRLSL